MEAEFNHLNHATWSASTDRVAECRTQDAEFSGPQIHGARGCGYFVTTVGRDEEMIRAYIRKAISNWSSLRAV